MRFGSGLWYKRSLNSQCSPSRRQRLGLAVTGVLVFAGCGSTNFGGSNQREQAHPTSGAATGTTSEPVPTNNTNANGNGGQTTLGSPSSNPGSTSTASTTTSQTTTGLGGLAGLISGIGSLVGDIPPSSGHGSSSSTSNSTSSSTSNSTSSVPSNMQLCSQSYYVPATSNPYLAGEPSGTSLTYTLNSGDPPTPTDTAPAESPVLVTPTNSSCIAPGASLYFSVYGGITYNASVAAANANGNPNMVVSHQLGAVNGKSNITAPIDALIGVFLDENDPATETAPSSLDFSSQSERDYTTLSPAIGQVFFIGTGQTSSGQYHQVIVPAGATRLYFATMDTYQWNNDVGGIYGAIMVANGN